MVSELIIEKAMISGSPDFVVMIITISTTTTRNIVVNLTKEDTEKNGG